MTQISLQKQLTGSILDVGGGGEGVIGRVYGPQVTAIDNRQEELDEAPDSCRKLLMDATALTFADASFDHVTFFFSLMYMDAAATRQALAEAARVLRPGGSLHIWDAVVDSAWPQPFLVELAIDADGTALQPTYGVLMPDAAQDAASIQRLCQACGLLPRESRQQDGTFYLEMQKPAGE